MDDKNINIEELLVLNTGESGRFGRNTIFLEMDGGVGKSGVF